MRPHTTTFWLIGEIIVLAGSGFVAGYLWPHPGPELELSSPPVPPMIEITAPAEPVASTTKPVMQGQFVASKSGSKYHPVTDCSYADRIKEENRIYFNTAKEAEAAGYEPSSCISQ